MPLDYPTLDLLRRNDGDCGVMGIAVIAGSDQDKYL